jgi:hypothetical protein
MEPTDKSVTKIGKDSYRTKEEVEADAKKLCKEPAMVVAGVKRTRRGLVTMSANDPKRTS